MQGLSESWIRLARDERGATAIEYGLIAMLVAVGALAAMMALGGGVSGSWGNTATQVTNAMSSPAP